jgi:hypothetical protein
LDEDGLFFHIDVVGRRFAFHQADEVAHLALERYVGDQPMAGFGVEARQVAGVRVAVGVAVLHIKEQHEVVAVV